MINTPPSVLFQRQMWATFQDDKVGAQTGGRIRPGELLLGLGLSPSGRDLAGLPGVHRAHHGRVEREDAPAAHRGTTWRDCTISSKGRCGLRRSPPPGFPLSRE